MSTGGLVIKTQDGTTYFVRDEILDACKVADDELEVTDAMVEASGDVEGFGLTVFQPVRFSAAAIASRATTPNKLPGFPGTGPDGTVMCCW